MRKSTGSYCTYSFLVKLQPRFLSLQWETCLWAELQPWCLSLQWRTCPWAKHWWWWWSRKCWYILNKSYHWNVNTFSRKTLVSLLVKVKKRKNRFHLHLKVLIDRKIACFLHVRLLSHLPMEYIITFHLFTLDWYCIIVWFYMNAAEFSHLICKTRNVNSEKRFTKCLLANK